MVLLRVGLEKVVRYFMSLQNKIPTTYTAPVRREIPTCGASKEKATNKSLTFPYWLRTLNEIRTFFKENPDTDF